MEASLANELFRRQLASYASVHRDPRNKATHFVGIPIIVFSLLLALSLWKLNLGVGEDASMAMVIGVIAALGWIALDLGIGLVMAALLLVAWYAAEALAGALGHAGTWTAFGVLFVGGWVLQFLGHHYEGKRPALIDNIFQAFVGPMFLVAEAMVVMGMRRDLAALMNEPAVTSR
jgi:uncharacterized membrane protein YGL010W